MSDVGTQLAALRAELLELRALGRATENPAILRHQVDRIMQVAVDVRLLDLPRAVEPHFRRCRGEETDDGEDCCSDHFPEPVDVRETGR